MTRHTELRFVVAAIALLLATCLASTASAQAADKSRGRALLSFLGERRSITSQLPIVFLCQRSDSAVLAEEDPRYGKNWRLVADSVIVDEGCARFFGPNKGAAGRTLVIIEEIRSVGDTARILAASRDETGFRREWAEVTNGGMALARIVLWDFRQREPLSRAAAKEFLRPPPEPPLRPDR